MSNIEVSARTKLIFFSKKQFEYKNKTGKFAEIEQFSNFLQDIKFEKKSGEYLFDLAVNIDGRHFCFTATPSRYISKNIKFYQSFAHSGMTRFSFYIDETLVLRCCDLNGSPANSNCPIC